MYIYLSGAISNDPDYLMKFKKHEFELLQKFEGCTVINPAEYGKILFDSGFIKKEQNNNHLWHDFMIYDLHAMKNCTHIYFIPENTESIGRDIEKLWAKKLNLITIEAIK